MLLNISDYLEINKNSLSIILYFYPKRTTFSKRKAMSQRLTQFKQSKTPKEIV